MKKQLQWLLLFVAFLMPGVANAQAQLTVANGTVTNEYVPVYGYYADAYLRAQMIYPATGQVHIAVIDINGREAASETMECAGDCVKTMNVDNLSQGAYFVRITGEQVHMVCKLIVR